MPPKNPFGCFLEKYRRECPCGSSSQSQKQLAKHAGNIWASMSHEQKYPFIQLAAAVGTNNKRIVHRSTSSDEDEEQSLDLAKDMRRTRTTTRRKCNNVAEEAKENMGRAHRLIECLLCHCEHGNYARELLFQFNQKATAFFPDVEDETFYVYYKTLITMIFCIGLFAVALSLWHFLV